MICLSILSLAITAQAQKKNKPTPSTFGLDTTTHYHAPTTKFEKTQAEADNYTRIAADTKNKLKILFPSKPGDTVYTVIPGISYTDPNLKLLKQKLDNVKGTKGLTSSYRNNTTIVKIIYKDGNASKLYDDLADDLKTLFQVEEIEGSRMILSYKKSNNTDSSGDKKLIAGDNTNQ